MTAITQDLLTIKRILPDGPVNLIGLTRDGLRAALIAAGTPEKQAKMRVGQRMLFPFDQTAPICRVCPSPRAIP